MYIWCIHFSLRLAGVKSLHEHTPWRKHDELLFVLLEKLHVALRETWDVVNLFDMAVWPVAANRASRMGVEALEYFVV